MLLVGALICAPVVTANDANQLVFNYDGFFDRMDDLNEPQFHNIKLAFYLKNKQQQSCDVESVWLTTKVDKMEVYYLPNGELLLPFDEQMDADKAAVVVNKSEQECGLSMRLESKVLIAKSFPKQQALELHKSFSEGLKEMAGMMAFLAPTVQGITFVAEGKTLRLENELGIKCELGMCTIINEQLTNLPDTLEFNIAPEKVLPYIK